MTDRPRSDRTRVRRIPARGHYDRATIDRILDDGLVAHVGFTADGGQPWVIPMLYARDGDRLLIHGSSASRLLTTLADGVDVCVTVSLIDGMVVARSAFHSSMNYRSVMALGRARAIEEPAAKWEALHRLTDFLIPGRWDDCRRPSEEELKATLILEMPIDEASAKIRTGGPNDDEADYALDYWAGVIPFARGTLAPVPDARLKPGVALPDYLQKGKRS
jgi:nitroimidazol reductase NimA-like FMN-containing flavoprotein (pyridoxamine 5'-phosphate oxidase superfamily)